MRQITSARRAVWIRTSAIAPLTLTHDQNVSRNPICPVLVDATLVILPKLGAVTVTTGSLYCSQLNALNDSARTCSRASPRMVKDFAIAMSTRRRPGEAHRHDERQGSRPCGRQPLDSPGLAGEQIRSRFETIPENA